MSAFASLTNRIFFATALLAVLSMGVAIFIVNRAVTRQGAQELERSIDENTTLVDEYSKFSSETFVREARLIADLPRLKAAVDTLDPATLEPVAREYQDQLVNADLFAIADNRGRVLVRLGTSDVSDEALAAVATIGRTEATERDGLWPERDGILVIKSVPIWIDKRQPDVLGTLILGKSLDGAQARKFREQTNSEIAFGVNGTIKAATLPESTWPALAGLLGKPGVRSSIVLNGEEYLAYANPLGPPGPGGQAIGIVLRSRAERQRFLTQLHTLLGAHRLRGGAGRHPAVLRGRAHRDAAGRGDHLHDARDGGERRPDTPHPGVAGRALAGRGRPAARDHLQLDDRFDREVSARGVGARAAVVPRPAVHGRGARDSQPADDHQDVAADAAARRHAPGAREDGGQGHRRGDHAPQPDRLGSAGLRPADQVRTGAGGPERAGGRRRARGRARPAGTRGSGWTSTAPFRTVTTDAERVRQALLNILDNALQAVAGREADVRLRTIRIDARRMAIVVTDNGGGIAPEDMPRLFDPYFTTRRTGTGIGLAISRNIIEGLGGRITVASERDRGTEVRIELPLDAPTA